MTYIMIKYEKASQCLIATVNEAREVKVVYNAELGTLSVMRKGEMIRTTPVRQNYPAKAFISYCLEIQRMFEPQTDINTKN